MSPLLLELLDDSREKAPAAMLQVHAVSDLANAGRLRLRGQIGDHLFAGLTSARSRLFILDGVLASHGWANCAGHQAKGIAARGKAKGAVSRGGRFTKTSRRWLCQWVAHRQASGPGVAVLHPYQGNDYSGVARRYQN